MIDLRSDTVTKPSETMLRHMSSAKVGDDVFEDDPTVKELENLAAELFAKEKGLFTSSGTQSNLIANILYAPPGSEIIMDHLSHPYLYEVGNVARFAGSQIHPVATQNGILTPEIANKHIRAENVHHPKTKLISIENTHNHGGGNAYTLEQIKAIFAFSQQNNIKMHIDGARIFNAIISQNYSSQQVGENTHSITFCLSKGLGCPIGSILLGDENFIDEARRIRKALGGGMRQVGYLAAAGIYALNNNINRLNEDHAKAKILAATIKEIGVECNSPESNIVLWVPRKNRSDTIENLKAHKILCVPFKETQIRFVTHLDFTDEQLETTISILKRTI